MGFQITYDHDKRECNIVSTKTKELIKGLYWNIQVTDEKGNTVTVIRSKERKSTAGGKKP